MYPENPEGTQVIVGSMNMGYISDTARNRTHNLFRPKREPIPLGHSGGPRGFFHASPTVWNSLPDDLRDPELAISCFRNKLKTFLFSKSIVNAN